MFSTGGLAPFYPIVPDCRWLARLVPLGVRSIQLRIKDADPECIRREIATGLDIAARFGCQLVVNDHWQAAIEVGADFVHLGQDDLCAADRSAIRAAGLRLGVSTHSEEELAQALAAEPDYVALGPIYPTTLKAMPWAPQGLGRISDWKARVGALPLVVIGGFTLERAAGAITAGAQSVAVVSDILTHANPELRTRAWLAWSAVVREGTSRPIEAHIRSE